MEKHICSCCGAPLEHRDDHYQCPYCDSVFEDDYEERAAYTLKDLLDEEKLEKLSNARKNLFDAAHVKYPSKEAVVTAARNVLVLNPDDALAKIYLYSHDRDPHRLNGELLALQVSLPEAEEIVRWLLPSLQLRSAAPLKHFIERHFRNESLTAHLNEVEDVIAKLDDGVYEAGLVRDVFIAYSSADMDKVVHVVDLLEENGLTCFAAFRNLRHGKGAAENYLPLLYQAMASCKVFLFLSSSASLNASCDVLKAELPYLTAHLPDKPRIQYVLEDVDYLPIVVKKTIKSAFPCQEWCREEEDLIMRIYEFIENGVSAPEKPNNSNAEIIEDSQSLEPIVPQEVKPSFTNKPEDFEIVDGCLKSYKGNDAAVIIPDSVTSIGEYAFKNHATLAYVVLPNSLISIDKYAFFSCSALPSITIPPSVQFLSHLAFIGCKALEKIILHSSLKAVDGEAFYSDAYHGVNGSLQIFFYIDSIKSFLEIPWKKNFAPVATRLLDARGKEITAVKVPESVPALPKRAFAGCVSLREIEIPAQATEIGERCFDGCAHLSSLKLPEGILSIGSYAFRGCSSLKSLMLPPRVTEIGECCFAGCAHLSSLKLPEGILRIGSYAFRGCSSLKSLTFPRTLYSVGESIVGDCVCDLVVQAKPGFLGRINGYDKHYLKGFNGKVTYKP